MTLGPVSTKASHPALPLCHFPKRRAKHSLETKPRPRSFLKRESNLLPRTWYLSEWGWGAGHQGASGQQPAGLPSAAPSYPADRRRHGGTGHREEQWVRANSSPGSPQPLRGARARRDGRAGRGERPGAALPRVLPAAPRLGRPPGGRRSHAANAAAGSQPPQPHSRPGQPWTNREDSARRGFSILPCATVPADRHVSQKPGSPGLPFT